MKKYFLKTICLLALMPFSSLLAQDLQMSAHHNLKVAFEFGYNVVSAGLVKPEQIRENRSSGYFYGDDYYDYYGHFGDYTSATTTYFGVKPEFFIFRNRLGIASGLRFTMASSDLVSDRDDFLWKINEDGLKTEYVRIKDILHRSYLLGVPLEIKVFPNNRELPFQHYFKIGASFNYRIYHNNQVNFTNKAMEKYDDLVHSQLPDGNAFSAFLFGAIGFKIGKYKEGRWIPWGNIEFQFPHFLLTNKSFVFAENINDIGFPGVGIQLSFQIPIGKNVPIGSSKSILINQ